MNSWDVPLRLAHHHVLAGQQLHEFRRPMGVERKPLFSSGNSRLFGQMGHGALPQLDQRQCPLNRQRGPL